MTEEEQLALALQMSMCGAMEGDMRPMETEEPTTAEQVTTHKEDCGGFLLLCVA